MNMKKSMTALLVSTLLSITPFAQSSGGGGSTSGQVPVAVPAYDPDIPLVPFTTISKGGAQAVASELFVQMERAVIILQGRSIVGQDGGSYNLDLAQLAQMGYVNRGSVSQFFQALTQLGFGANVVPLADGTYDVFISIACFNSEGKTCLQGGAWINITDGPEETLRVDVATPYIWVPSQVAIRVDGEVTAARWLGSDNSSEELANFRFEGYSKIIVQDRMFDDGSIVITVNAKGGPHSQAFNMVSGVVVEGKDFYTRLGIGRSSKFFPVNTLPEVANLGFSFFQAEDGQVYGDYPVIQWDLASGFLGTLSFDVPIYGSKESKRAIKITIKVIGTHPPFAPGAEFDIIPGQFYRIDPGVYHIQTTYNGVKTWSLYRGGKG